VHEYAPSQVKQAITGSGRAGKEQMMRTARALLGVDAERSDEADAIALAVCHLARRPLAVAAVAAPRAAAARALSRLRPSRRDHRKAP
jgi:crossover junction endodeoxyribonuclease RuvC